MKPCGASVSALRVHNRELHSRVVLWNLLIIAVLSPFLAYLPQRFPTCTSHSIASVITLFSGNLVNILITQPLRRIAQASQKLAAGDLQQRLPISGDEEIAALGNSLNAMAEHLSARMYELTEGKQRLEMIVGAMSEGVMVLDNAGRITLTNKALRNAMETGRDLTGKRRSTLFGARNWKALFGRCSPAVPTEIVELVTDRRSHPSGQRGAG